MTNPDQPVWRFTAGNAWRRFSANQGSDLAAALTYYSVQSLFPALLALVSLFGVFGHAQATTRALLDLIQRFMPGSATSSLEPIITAMVDARGSGIALVIGILVATWSASGYVGAFARAMNRIYGVPEGRPVWKLRPTLFGLTIVIELMAALVLVGLAVSGALATAVFSLIGIGSVGLRAWNIAKWPGLVLVVMFMIALLYHVTPNVRRLRFRWLSVGALVALIVWILASTGFGFYVANFGNYNKTYGTLAGIIVMLLWLWLTNVALLLGAQVDAEIVQVRQLLAGMAAERHLVADLKDDRGALKSRERAQQAERAAREIRLAAALGPTVPRGHGTPRRGTELDADGFVVEHSER